MDYLKISELCKELAQELTDDKNTVARCEVIWAIEERGLVSEEEAGEIQDAVVNKIRRESK